MRLVLRIPKRSLNSTLKAGYRDGGYTMIEMILVLIMTSLLAGMFSVTLISSIEIYTKHNLRKSAEIDARRAMDMITHDVREWRSWQNPPTTTSLDFNKIYYYRVWFLLWYRYYYEDLRVGYNLTADRLVFKKNTEGNWSNEYTLVQNGVVGGTSQFTTNVAGGTTRVVVELTMTVQGKPMRFRTTVFPRIQGG